MEEEAAAVGQGKDRPTRSRRSAGAVTSIPSDQPVDQSSVMSSADVPPGDQAFQAAEKTPEKEVSESALSAALEFGSHAMSVPGKATAARNGISGEVAQSLPNPAITVEASGIYRPVMDMSHTPPGTTGQALPPSMVYEGSTVIGVRVPPPSSYSSLPLNTTDDAKLVNHYEHTIGFTAPGPHRTRHDQSHHLSGTQEHAQQFQRKQPAASGAQPGHGLQGESPRGNVDSRIGNSETSHGITPSGRGVTLASNAAPLELGLVHQLAELGQPKQRESSNNVSTPDVLPQENEYQSRDVNTISGSSGNIGEQDAYPESLNTTYRRNNSQPNLDGSHEAQPAAQEGQSLKNILANIVLEEQVITIKLHRDLPPRRNRRDRQSWSRAGPASATDIRPPDLLAPHSEDQVTHLSTEDRWGHFGMHRAISNIETPQDRESFLTTAEIGYHPTAASACTGAESGLSYQNGATAQHEPVSTSVIRQARSDVPFVQDTSSQEPAVAGPKSRRSKKLSVKLAHPGRPTAPPSPAAVAEEERLRRLNVVVQRTGRRSAPVFSRRGFGTAEFWNSGQTSINRAIWREIFSRPPSSTSGRRSRAQDRDRFGRERSLSVGAERRGHRSKRLFSDANTESESQWQDGRASAPVDKSSKRKRTRRKLASYGSMEERRPRHSLDTERGGAAENDVMSNRYSRDREDWEESDDALVEHLFRDDAGQPRARHGIRPGFRFPRKATPRSLLLDSAGPGRPLSVGPASIPRPLSVQGQDSGVDIVSGTISRVRRGDKGEEGEHTGSSESSSSSDEDETSALLKETKTEIYRRRWYLLFLFSMTALVWNAIWSTWGPIAQSAKQVYSWGDGDIAMFTWLGNLPFLITMFPIAYLMDVKGMRTATVLCCGLMCLGAGLRCIPCDTHTATWLIRLGQLLNGVAGTVPISGPGLLSGLWFPPNQRATATAISTVSGYLGACVSFVLGPLLVKAPSSLSPVNGTSVLLPHLDAQINNLLVNNTEIEEQKKGIELILYSEFAAAAVLFILVVIYFPSKPPLPPSISASVPREEYLAGLKLLVRNKQFWVTAIAYSVPIGVYEVWQVVLDVILDPKVSQQTAGWMDFYATIGGCISGLVVSRFADLFTRQMKVFLLVFYFLATASMLWFSLLVAGILPFDVGMVYAAMVVGGVFLDGGAPLFFELVIEVSYPVGEGVTSGCLQMICAGAGVFFLSLVQIKSIGKNWMNWLFTGCITLAIPLLFFIKTNYGRADIDDIDFDVSSSSSSSSSSEDEEESGEGKEIMGNEDIETGNNGRIGVQLVDSGSQDVMLKV